MKRIFTRYLILTLITLSGLTRVSAFQDQFDILPAKASELLKAYTAIHQDLLLPAHSGGQKYFEPIEMAEKEEEDDKHSTSKKKICSAQPPILLADHLFIPPTFKAHSSAIEHGQFACNFPNIYILNQVFRL